MHSIQPHFARQLARATCAILVAVGSSTITYAQPAPNHDTISAIKEIGNLIGRTSDPKVATLFDAQEKRIRGNLSKIRQQATTELAKLGTGRDSKEADKLMLERSRRAGVPSEVLGYVQAAGGPTKVIAEIDTQAEIFLREARAEVLRPRAALSVDHVVAAIFMAQPADARIGAFARQLLARTSCSLVVWVAGGTSDENYSTCM